MLVATNNFLVPNATLIVEIIDFGVILFVLSKWVFPPITRAMQKRQEQIRSSLEAADQARAEAAQVAAQHETVLDQARAEARAIVARANRAGEQIKAEAQARGQQEYERIVASADTEITMARQRATDELTRQFADLVMSAAERVVGEELDRRRHEALIDDVIRSVGTRT